MKIKALLIASFLIFPLFLSLAQEDSSQESDSWYIGKKIHDIVFEGLVSVRTRELQTIVGQYIGSPFTEDAFLELQSGLYALDFFNEIIANAQPLDESREEVIIIFTVTERPVIQEVKISGHSSFTKLEITREIKLKKGSFVSNVAMREDREAIASMYKKRGFIDMNIELSFQEAEQALQITITEGIQLRVRKIVFVGNKIMPSKKLKRAIESKEMNIFRKGYFLDTLLEADTAKIHEYYKERGYVDAEVLNIEEKIIEEDRKKRQRYLEITYLINEGQQYFFGGISFQGNVTFTDEYLSSFILHKTDKIIDLPRLEEEMRNVTEQYYENGYIFNEITPFERREGNKIFYELRIVETGRAHIENIIIQGNEKTKDFVIKRELDIKVGEVFNNQKLRQAYFNLANLRFFDAIDIQPVRGSSEGLMDVVFALEEGRTMDITAGLGIALGGTSSNLPISLNLRWSERNLVGTGLELSTGATLSMTSQRFDFGIYSDWLFGERIFSGASFYVWHDVLNNVRQDLVPPNYNDNIPDPYSGDFVFSNDQTHENVKYSKGEYFPGYPTTAQIKDLKLTQDFLYAKSTGALYNNGQNLMKYDSIRFGLAFNGGYRYLTPVGSLVPSIRFNFAFDYLTYDSLLYRPHDLQTRNNLNTVLNVNSMSLALAWDMRDLRFNPSQGMYASQGFILTGGFLYGTRHFIRSNSRLDVYIPLVDLPVSETWSWKMVLGMQTTFSILMDYFAPEGGSFETVGPADSDKLLLDGIFNARGWPVEREGEAIWNSWIELRMELARDVVWFDFFFEAARLWQDRNDLAIHGIETMKFTVGAGFRFVLNQFPLRFYFGKRFKIDESGQAIWQTSNIGGDASDPTKGIDFIFSMTYEFF